LQKTTTELEDNTYHDNFNPEVKRDDGLFLSGESSHKILDTAELFHANLAIDDITFQEYRASCRYYIVEPLCAGPSSYKLILEVFWHITIEVI
jgi:hypothetical protein